MELATLSTEDEPLIGGRLRTSTVSKSVRAIATFLLHKSQSFIRFDLSRDKDIMNVLSTDNTSQIMKYNGISKLLFTMNKISINNNNKIEIMKNGQFFKSLLLAFVVGLFSLISTNSFGQTLKIAHYGYGDFDELSITETTPYQEVECTTDPLLGFNHMPSDVSGYAGVDLLYMQWGSSGGENITQAQADAILQYVKDGGVLVYNGEGQQIIDPRNGIRPSFVGAFLATELTCGNSMECLTINHMASHSPANCIGDGPFTSVSEPNVYHAGDGNLLVTDGVEREIEYGSTGRCTPQNSTIAWYVGVPPENAILLANPLTCVTNSSGSDAPCSALAVLDLVAPAYPGTPNECGVQGMALISGETNGILQGTFGTNDRAYYGCMDIFNENYANLVYDFINDPAAMAVRNAWSSDPSNVSSDCSISGPPAAPGAGTIDCTKTQIATAPVVGEPGQKTLLVTIDVTTAGCLSPITISGSGISVANGITEVCTGTIGVQTFSIPVQYDGSALGTTNFTVGTGNDCTADLTNTPIEIITPIYTLDCVPTSRPTLK